MKYFKTLATLFFSLVIAFYACNDSTKSTKQETSEPLEVTDSPTPTNTETSTDNSTPTNTTTTNPTTTETSQNTAGVFHYTCSNGCVGGAGSAVNCVTCGSLLVHNTAFHANTNTTQTATPFFNPPTTEASKSTAGVWHYTCAKGCAGGSGSAGNCATCGGTLTHNTAYHQ